MSTNNYKFNTVGEVVALSIMLEEKSNFTEEEIQDMSLTELGDNIFPILEAEITPL